MKRVNWGAVALSAVAVMCGMFAARSSWDGMVFVSDGSTAHGNKRRPAAIRPDLDFSGLVGAELILATERRLVSAASVIAQGGDVGIELGAFVARDDSGQRLHVCQHYDRMTLRFEAEGMAESGSKPILEIEGPCAPSRDISRIAPLWIPVERITGMSPGTMDLRFDDQVSFRFDDMGADWPVDWSLQSVRLYNEQDEDRDILIDAREIRDILSKPLVMSWRKRAPGSAVQ